MPITGAFWRGETGRDRHVLPGHTLSLGDDLLFEVSGGTETSANVYMPAHPGDVKLRYTPLFKGTMVGNELRGFGIRVNVTNGSVTIESSLPAPTKANFIIEVDAENQTGNRTIFRAPIRIHVHRSVVDVWLTPTQLTVRPLDATRPVETPARFSIRAQFDDQVVADITANHGVTWGSTSGNVTADGRLRINAGDTVGQVIDITATTSAAFGARVLTGKMRVGGEWSAEPVKPKAILSPGGSWPSVAAVDTALNVLILGDGFPDEKAFSRQVHTLVHYLHTSQSTRPFDVLRTSMNFWRVRFPGSQAINVRSELHQLASDPSKVEPVPIPLRLPPPQWFPPSIPEFRIEHLVYQVGLPIPGDEGKTNLAIRSEWTQQASADPNPIVPDDMVTKWKRLALRGFADHVDQFPWLAMGFEPEVAFPEVGYALHLDSERIISSTNTTRDVPLLRAFIDTIEADNGVTLADGSQLGRIWTRPPTGTSLDNRTAIVVLTSLPTGRGRNQTFWTGSTSLGKVIIVTGTPEPASLDAVQSSSRRAFSILPWTVKASIARDASRVLAHELGHSCGLGDEYAEFPTTFTDPPNSLDRYGNLQADADLRATPTGPIDAERIKWRWHRIRKAAVLMNAPTPSGGGFQLSVRAGEAKAFAKDEIVRLRVRLPGRPLLRLQTTLERDLKITADPVGDTLQVAPVDGGSMGAPDVAPFVAGSIVYVPVEAPASVLSPTYPYAELIAKRIKDFIASTDAPLKPCVLEGLPESTAVQTPAVILPLTLGDCRKQLRQYVGLYPGGDTHACGVYHPTGLCIMRSRERGRPFCPVCRYIMVDMLNPVLHGEIDRDYERIYPH